ncbi:MAG TPA: gamma carbonic anhydrase family protein [Vicinamibacteria bacterium]|nr:gamma carbonic anhydrase family protein [Vicinamibacteria bacterium]
MIRAYRGVWPRLGERVYVDVSAQVIGQVELGDHASVWMNAVIRGDVNLIRIGVGTNVQDNCVVHVFRADHPTLIGDHVTVGHSVTLHGCTIGPRCLIGMGATILNDAEVGEECIIAAGTLVPERMKIPPRQLVMGLPARIRRDLTAGERESLRRSADNYIEYKETYLQEAAAPGRPPTGEAP